MTFSEYEKALFNNPVYKVLFAQKEFRNRTGLKANEYYLLAHLMMTEKYAPYHIVSTNPQESQEDPNLGFVHISKEDTVKAFKFKFRDAIKGNIGRYNNTLVPQFRRVLGHILFCSGALVSVSMVAFDKTFHYEKEYVAPYVMAYPKFDDIKTAKAVANIRNAAMLATKTVGLGNRDYLLDRAILLSGEAIGAWHVQELSLFSAWRAIETMAKRRFVFEMKAKRVSNKHINNDWNYNSIGS